MRWTDRTIRHRRIRRILKSTCRKFATPRRLSVLRRKPSLLLRGHTCHSYSKASSHGRVFPREIRSQRKISRSSVRKEDFLQNFIGRHWEKKRPRILSPTNSFRRKIIRSEYFL